MYTLLIICYR